jgi:thymidylate kinase
MRFTLKKIPKHVVQLNKDLISANIRYIHWKSNIHIIDGLVGDTDLDILVHPDDKEAFESIIVQSFFTQVISPIWCNYPHVDDFVGCDPETSTMIHLHIHYQMITGFKRVKHFVIPWEEEVLKSRIIDKETGWATPSFVDEFIIFIIRIQLKSHLRSFFLKKSFYPDHIISEYKFLSNRVGKNQLLSRTNEFGIKLNDKDANILLSNNYDLIKNVGSKIIAQIPNGARYSLIATFFISFYKGVLYWNSRRIHKNGGLSIFKKVLKGSGLSVALIGVDGSGKSSVTQSTVEWLIPKVDAHIIYMGSGIGKKGSMEKIRSNLRKKNPINNRNNSFFRVFVRSVFDTMLIVRKTIVIKKIKKMSNCGSIVIMDRFPQNQFFGINDGPKIPKLKSLFLLRIIENYCFKIIDQNTPDLVIRLDIDFKTSMSRKPDHNPDVIREKVTNIKKINFNNTVVVDAKKDIENVILTVKRVLWAAILDKQK